MGVSCIDFRPRMAFLEEPFINLPPVQPRSAVPVLLKVFTADHYCGTLNDDMKRTMDAEAAENILQEKERRGSLPVDQSLQHSCCWYTPEHTPCAWGMSHPYYPTSRQITIGLYISTRGMPDLGLLDGISRPL